MTIREYVEMSKAELDAFQKDWEEKHSLEPQNYPTDLDEGEWVDQELASRFGVSY